MAALGPGRTLFFHFLKADGTENVLRLDRPRWGRGPCLRKSQTPLAKVNPSICQNGGDTLLWEGSIRLPRGVPKGLQCLH